MRIDYRTYENTDGLAPAEKRFFCLPFFLMEGKLHNVIFTYGETAEEARGKAEEFWNAEIAKAQANHAKTGVGGSRGRPQATRVTPAMLAKIGADFNPKG